jgi:hypothetical protein
MTTMENHLCWRDPAWFSSVPMYNAGSQRQQYEAAVLVQQRAFVTNQAKEC